MLYLINFRDFVLLKNPHNFHVMVFVLNSVLIVGLEDSCSMRSIASTRPRLQPRCVGFQASHYGLIPLSSPAPKICASLSGIYLNDILDEQEGLPVSEWDLTAAELY